MSANEQPTSSPANLLETLIPGLSNLTLSETGRTAESLDTVRFAFNPWCRILNFSIAGFNFGIQLPWLERMTLIPLRVWKTPVIQPRAGGFAVGAITGAGAFPGGGVGSKVEQRIQFPAESRDNLLHAFGPESPNDIGVTELVSLVADTDQGKLESILLFRAVMETPLEEGGKRGIDLELEYLPKFLAGDALELLRRAVQEGLKVNGKLATLRNEAVVKGRVMIANIETAVAHATRRAMDENSGILSLTKKDLIAASKGMKDVKVIPDELDNWLLKQFPSYSLDTDVERATRANRSVTDAIQQTGQDNSLTMREMMAMQQQTLVQLERANETNRLLAERLAQTQAAPAAPAP